MKVLKWIGIILVSLVVILLIIALILPKNFSVERSVVIDAPRDQVYEELAYLANFDRWSPWAKLDTAMQFEINGQDGTVGATYEWEGNEDVGKGKITIDHMQDDSIAQTLTFLEPWESSATTYYTLEDTAGKVRVSWGFQTSAGIPMNIFLALGGMEDMVAEDFQKGLDTLKSLVEGAAEAPYQVEEIDIAERTYLVKRGQVKFSEMSEFYDDAFGTVHSTIGSTKGLESLGMPTGIFFTWDEDNRVTEMAAGMQINNPDYTPPGSLTTVKIGPGMGLKIAYYGAYGGSGEAHYQMEDYINEKGYGNNAIAFEAYVTDPGSRVPAGVSGFPG
jgi:hypothetical protein